MDLFDDAVVDHAFVARVETNLARCWFVRSHAGASQPVYCGRPRRHHALLEEDVDMTPQEQERSDA